MRTIVPCFFFTFYPFYTTCFFVLLPASHFLFMSSLHCAHPLSKNPKSKKKTIDRSWSRTNRGASSSSSPPFSVLTHTSAMAISQTSRSKPPKAPCVALKYITSYVYEASPFFVYGWLDVCGQCSVVKEHSIHKRYTPIGVLCTLSLLRRLCLAKKGGIQEKWERGKRAHRQRSSYSLFLLKEERRKKKNITLLCRVRPSWVPMSFHGFSCCHFAEICSEDFRNRLFVCLCMSSPPNAIHTGGPLNYSLLLLCSSLFSFFLNFFLTFSTS
jgi:hypothetical protein